MKKAILTIAVGAFTFGSNAQTQPPNIGYENWETLNGPISNTYMEPIDWNSSNECTAIVNQFSVTQSTDAHSGTYSARLETKSTSFAGIIANGVLTTGNMICLAQGGGQEGGMAFTTAFPDSIIGWYKYAPQPGDSAYAQLMFLDNGDVDTTCLERIDFHAQAEWTRFAVATCEGITSTPEKLSLLFSSSWGDGSQGQAVVGSILFIDDVEFSYPPDVSVGDEPSVSNWSVYPNPAVDFINVSSIQGENAYLEILDVTGTRVAYELVRGAGSGLDISEFVPGLYLYQIRSLDSEVLKTGKLLVNP